MSGSVSVTAVLGVGSSSPHCYVLRVDDWSLLLDAGWTADMDEALFTPAALALLASVDAVLLSHSSLRHCGALPYLRRRLSLSCPVYATLPVCRMGAMTLYDHYQQHVAGITPERRSDSGGSGSGELAADAAGELYSLDDIDAVFDSMRLLKYSEERPLADKLAAAGEAGGSSDASASSAAPSSSPSPSSSSSSRLVISPHSSGHSVGGCVWRIVCEGAVLLYAVDYNHSRERHLEGGLLEAFTRPSLLVMDAASLSPPPALPLPLAAAAPLPATRKARESRLLDAVLGCVNSGGVCLLPVDSAGRVLELLSLLHLTWEASRMYERVPLLFCSPQAGTTVEFVQQQVEWLSDAMQKHFNTERSNPFHLPHLHTVADIQQLDALTQRCTRPAVILATSHSLQPNSLALAVLERIAQQPNSLVLLTHELESGTVAHDLFTRAGSVGGAPFRLSFRRPSRVALEGEELRQHVLRARVREEQRLMESSQQAPQDEQRSDDDEDDEVDSERPNAAVLAVQVAPVTGHGQSLAQPHILPATAPLPSVSSHTSFPAFYQFPFSDPRRQSDLYGDYIDHSQHQQPAQPTQSAVAGNPVTHSPPHTSALAHTDLHSSARPALPSAASTPPSSSAVTAPPDAPVAASKCVWQAAVLEVACGVQYVDFRGVSDAKGWKNIVSHVKPRKLVLVHGQDDEKVAFKAYCDDKRIGAPAATASTDTQQQPDSTAKAMEVDDQTVTTVQLQAAASKAAQSSSGVFVAAAMSAVDISSDLSYRFGMAPSLLSRLAFARVADYEVAHTTAVVSHSDSVAPQLVSVSNTSSSSPDPAAPKSAVASGVASVFLGDYRFADFRRVLAAAGIDSEFYVKGGVLVAAGGSVRIRKTSPNTLTVQGIVSEQFYSVRQLLYSQYSVVTPVSD